MSFYVVSQPLNTKICVPEKCTLIFAKVLEIKQKLLLLFDVNSRLFVYNLKEESLLSTLTLKSRNQKIMHSIVEINEFDDTIWLITSRSIFVVSYEQIQDAVEKNNMTLQTKILKIYSQNIKEIAYSKFMNKCLNIVTFKKQKYLKLSLRSKDAIIYYAGKLDSQQSVVYISLEYQQMISPHYNANIKSNDLDLVMYNTFSNKTKPVQLYIHEAIPSSNTFSLITSECKVNHFLQTITIIQAFKLNHDLVCLFGNQVSAECTSCMIIYNFKDRFTRNYLTFNDTSITRIKIYQKGEYEWGSLKGKAIFEAFQDQKYKNKYFELTPWSYIQKQDNKLKGKLISSDQRHITTLSQSIVLYPKISKKSIYLSFLNKIRPSQPQFHFQVLSLLV